MQYLLLLDNLGLLHSLLQELGDAGADRLDLLDHILWVVGQEFSGSPKLVLELLALNVRFVSKSARAAYNLFDVEVLLVGLGLDP